MGTLAVMNTYEKQFAVSLSCFLPGVCLFLFGTQASKHVVQAFVTEANVDLRQGLTPVICGRFLNHQAYVWNKVHYPGGGAHA